MSLKDIKRARVTEYVLESQNMGQRDTEQEIGKQDLSQRERTGARVTVHELGSQSMG